MSKNDPVAVDDVTTRGARLRIPRSRGALSGLLLLLLGAWGALAPLVGPYFHAGFTPDSTWHFSSGRFWLEILPGAVTALGGLLLLLGANRITTSFGAWLAVAGGAWFVVGPALRDLLHLGPIGAPIHTSRLGSALETLLLFNGLGALILFLAATAVGRLSVIGVRDVQAAQRRAAQNATPEPEPVIRDTPLPQDTQRPQDAPQPQDASLTSRAAAQETSRPAVRDTDNRSESEPVTESPQAAAVDGETPQPTGARSGATRIDS